jgi:hypothetical protein
MSGRQDALAWRGTSTDPIRMRRAIEQPSVWLAQAMPEGTAALRTLRTTTTQTNDLAEALRRVTEEGPIASSMAVTFSVIGDAREMHPIVRDEIYRIAHEAIHNACVQSKASNRQSKNARSPPTISRALLVIRGVSNPGGLIARRLQAAEYHFCEDFRGDVTTTPSGIEVFGWRSRDHFIHCFSCCDEILNALLNLHQHVTVILQICARGYWTMARHDLRLRVSLRQNSVDRMDHAID